MSVYSLFFDRSQFPKSACLSTIEDQRALWSKLEAIDVFSVGATPYLLTTEEGETTSPWSGMEETLPLLLTAVADGRLILEDIHLRLHDKL